MTRQLTTILYESVSRESLWTQKYKRESLASRWYLKTVLDKPLMPSIFLRKKSVFSTFMGPFHYDERDTE